MIFYFFSGFLIDLFDNTDSDYDADIFADFEVTKAPNELFGDDDND